MAIIFDHGRIRLYGGGNERRPNIGIKFNADCAREEVEQVYKNIKSFLISKYGEGVVSDKKTEDIL